MGQSSIPWQDKMHFILRKSVREYQEEQLSRKGLQLLFLCDIILSRILALIR